MADNTPGTGDNFPRRPMLRPFSGRPASHAPLRPTEGRRPGLMTARASQPELPPVAQPPAAQSLFDSPSSGQSASPAESVLESSAFAEQLESVLDTSTLLDREDASEPAGDFQPDLPSASIDAPTSDAEPRSRERLDTPTPLSWLFDSAAKNAEPAEPVLDAYSPSAPEESIQETFDATESWESETSFSAFDEFAAEDATEQEEEEELIASPWTSEATEPEEPQAVLDEAPELEWDRVEAASTAPAELPLEEDSPAFTAVYEGADAPDAPSVDVDAMVDSPSLVTAYESETIEIVDATATESFVPAAESPSGIADSANAQLDAEANGNWVQESIEGHEDDVSMLPAPLAFAEDYASEPSQEDDLTVSETDGVEELGAGASAFAPALEAITPVLGTEAAQGELLEAREESQEAGTRDEEREARSAERTLSVADTLEAIAHRVRLGEIVVAADASASPEAILASVLASLLSTG